MSNDPKDPPKTMPQNSGKGPLAALQKQNKTLANIANPAANLNAQNKKLSKDETSILFIFDTTASRHETWKDAQKWQSEMIDEYASYGARVGVIAFGGNEIQVLGWYTNGGTARDNMSNLQCVSGGTQIIPAIDRGLYDQDTFPDAIVLVGDCFEESQNDLQQTALNLKNKKIPVHAFHEGHDNVGEKAYRYIAKNTGGVFAKFGPNMPLKDIVSALFVYTVKGETAFKALISQGNPAAKQLESGGLLALPSGSTSDSEPQP